jgi:hypothetical protein
MLSRGLLDLPVWHVSDEMAGPRVGSLPVGQRIGGSGPVLVVSLPWSQGIDELAHRGVANVLWGQIAVGDVHDRGRVAPGAGAVARPQEAAA